MRSYSSSRERIRPPPQTAPSVLPWSAEATAERQAFIADLADDGVFGVKGTKTFARSLDWRTEADRILATVRAKKQVS